MMPSAQIRRSFMKSFLDKLISQSKAKANKDTDLVDSNGAKANLAGNRRGIGYLIEQVTDVS